MKVGDYVRTKYGYIEKIVDINLGDFKKRYELDNGLLLYQEEIIKSSPNIIDLIEVGDYVNGRIVDDYIYLDKLGLIGLTELEKEDEKFIKSIVTKEQMEAMQYEVK